MKKIILIIIITIFSLGVILAGTGLILAEGNFTEPFTKTEKIINETNVVTSLKLNIFADSVEFYPSNDGLLHIAYWDCDTNPFIYTYLDGTAELSETKNYFSRLNKSNYESKTIKVYIPVSLSDTLTVSLSSGSLYNNRGALNVGTININIGSGNVCLDNITAENITVDVASGYINVTNSHINDTLDIKLISGGLNLQSSYINAINTVIDGGNVYSDGLETTSINMMISYGEVNMHLIGHMQDYTMQLKNSNLIYVEDGDEHIKAIDWLQGRENEYVLGADGEYHPVVSSHQICVLSGDGEYSIICECSYGNINIYFE